MRLGGCESVSRRRTPARLRGDPRFSKPRLLEEAAAESGAPETASTRVRRRDTDRVRRATMRLAAETRMPPIQKGSSGIALRLMRRVNVPRAPSLELYVLPN